MRNGDSAPARRALSAAAAGLLTVVATIVALVAPTPAMAASSGWYMLVNNLYDGVNAPGPMRCLAAKIVHVLGLADRSREDVGGGPPVDRV